MTHIFETSKIGCVSFDAGGTLIHLKESVGLSYSRIAKEFDIVVEAKLIDQSFRTVWKSTLPAFHPNTATIVDEKQWWRQLVFDVFRVAMGGDDFTSPKQFSSFFDNLYHYYGRPEVWQLDPDAIEVLDNLQKQGLTVAMISNFDERLVSILDHLGIGDRFKPLVLSNSVKASKPSEKIFRHALDLIGLQPAEVLHVGDDLECDHKGAIAVGMQSLLVGQRYGNLKDVIKVIS